MTDPNNPSVTPEPTNPEQPREPLPTPTTDDVQQPVHEPPTPYQEQRPSQVPVVLWIGSVVFIIIAAIAGGFVGYSLGLKSAPESEQATTTVTTTVKADGATKDAEDTTPAIPYEDIVKTVKPGTGRATAKPMENGDYDASIFGPHAPLHSAKDVMNVHRRLEADPYAIGPVDAPVVLTLFSDLECPFCARWANDTEKMILDKYVSKGLVRLEFNDMPINGEHADAAAKAGRAAAAQGKFWEFEEALYDHAKDIPGHPNNTIDQFVEFAKKAGVPDIERFKKEATDGTYDEVINNAHQYGQSIGINGTPASVVGETYVSGAQPNEVFEKIINAELMKVHDGKVTTIKPNSPQVTESETPSADDSTDKK